MYNTLYLFFVILWCTCTSLVSGGVPSQVTGIILSGSSTYNSIPIAWLAPSSDGGSPVTSYTVWALMLLNPQEFGNPTWYAYQTTTTHFLITGINVANNHTYLIKVTASNMYGAGPDSAMVSIPTATGNTIPSAPAPPTVVSVTSTSVTLNWTAPYSNGGLTVTAYQMIVSASGVSAYSAYYGSALSCVVTGLNPNMQYTFGVAAYNSLGGSYQSWPTLATTAMSSSSSSSSSTTGPSTAAPTPPPPCPPYLSTTFRVWDLNGLGVLTAASSCCGPAKVSLCNLFSSSCSANAGACLETSSLGALSTQSISTISDSTIKIFMTQGAYCGSPVNANRNITIYATCAATGSTVVDTLREPSTCVYTLNITVANAYCGQVLIPPPNPIGTLTLVSTLSSSLQISWVASPNALYYKTYIKKQGDTTYVIGNTTNTQFTFTGLQSDTTYLVNVVAVGSSGQSPPESDRTFKTIAACYTNVLIDRTTYNNLSIFWTAFKPAQVPTGIQMLSPTAGIANAVWAPNRMCVSAVTRGFYARVVFNALGNLDGLALVLQPLSTNVIGANGASFGVENGNITTAFSLELSVYYAAVIVYTAKNGTKTRVQPLSISFPYSSTITAEMWYHPTRTTQVGRISIAGVPATPFSFALDLSSTFSGYDTLLVGATSATGGVYNTLTLNELYVGDYCTTQLCNGALPSLQACNSASGAYTCGMWGSCGV